MTRKTITQTAAAEAESPLTEPFPYSAAQLTATLIKAMRENAPDDIKEGIAGLLAIHYPKEYRELEIAVAVAGILPGTR